MNIQEIIKENQLLKEELEKTKLELNETREHLKKYTAPTRNKIYYEEKINYNATLSAEKKKEYARTAYLNKKAKLQKMKESENI